MLTKINLWKMAGLYVVTLGVYGIIWLSKRRNEIATNYKLPLPHWLWMVAPSIIALALILPIVFIGYALLSDLVLFGMMIAGVLIFEFVVVFGISIWWIWKLGQAVEKITEGRMPLGWTVAYWILCGPIVLFILQYLFNHIQSKVDVKAAPKHKPTKRFVFVSILVFATSIVISIAQTALIINSDSGSWTTFTREAREIDHTGNKADRLLKQYNTCMDRLNEKYPGELMIENEAGYNKGYNECESIRVKQNAAAEEYNAKLEDW